MGGQPFIFPQHDLFLQTKLISTASYRKKCVASSCWCWYLKYVPIFLSSSSNVFSNNNHSGEGNGTPLQYSCLENPMDGGASWSAVHGVAKSRTWVSDFPFTFHFHDLEKEMATHSSFLAWRVPGAGEPGGLLSMGSRRVGHDRSDLTATTIIGDARISRKIFAFCFKSQWSDNW